MQSRLGVSFDSQSLPRLAARMLILAIVCGGFVLEQVGAQYHGDSDHIVYPGPVDSRSRDRALDNEPARGSAGDDSDTPISIDLATKINSIDSLEQFMQLLHDIPENERAITFSNRFGAEERSNAVMPTPAKCIPELQLVSLKLDDDPSTFVFPLCTRVKRCGGCCMSSLLSCQPTENATVMRNFEVIVTSLNDLSYRGRRIVPVEEHTKCKCDCKVKEKHCNDKQHYEPHNCTCACSNVDEEAKCRRNDMKIWNSSLCACSCRTIEPCTTGYYFNPNTCRCGPIMLSRPVNRFAPTNYNFTARWPENRRPVIIPLDPSDPRRKHKEDPEYK